MESSNLKNMVILRNLPSNLVEEAIIVLKTNKNAKKLEKIDKLEKKEIKNQKINEQKKDNKYILREAEMLVSSYIAKLENRNNKKLKSKENTRKFNRLKNYAYISSIIIFLQAMILLIK